MGFRAVEQLIPQFDNAGAILADGTLTFSLTGTATPASVFTNPGLSTPCENPLGLDSAGRPDTDCWAGVPLRVVVKDSAGNVIRTLDNVQAPSSDDTTLPAFEDGKFLTNDGAVASWETISQVPDASGSEGRFLKVVGGVAAWAEGADEFDYDNLPGGIEQTATTYRIGDLLVQYSSGTAPTSGTERTSLAVTWPTALDAAPLHVEVTPTIAQVTTEGAGVSWAVVGATATGATIHFFAGAEDLGTGTNNITSAVTFTYRVDGIKAL